jgi:hypothetical protein
MLASLQDSTMARQQARLLASWPVGRLADRPDFPGKFLPKRCIGKMPVQLFLATDEQIGGCDFEAVAEVLGCVFGIEAAAEQRPSSMHLGGNLWPYGRRGGSPRLKPASRKKQEGEGGERSRPCVLRVGFGCRQPATPQFSFAGLGRSYRARGATGRYRYCDRAYAEPGGSRSPWTAMRPDGFFRRRGAGVS